MAVSQWIKKVVDGCKVRILVLKPCGDETKIRQRHESRLPESEVAAFDRDAVKEAVGDILRKIEAQSRDRKGVGFFKFGFYDIVPYCCVNRIGRRMLVTNYLYRIVGNFCPALRLQEGGGDSLFAKYMTHFDMVWKSDKAWVYELKNWEPELVLARDSEPPANLREQCRDF